jgi:glutamyl-tRNA synthetase
LILRIEDLDHDRCNVEFRDAIIEDLRWFGLRWDEGPDTGGAFAPYLQSERREIYLAAWKRLRDAALIYPCVCSRRDVLQSAGAPHHENEEPVYPGTCRPEKGTVSNFDSPEGRNWRFRVPEAEAMRFVDQRLGTQYATAGADFGDFIIWRKDDVPAYQLAVVTDDSAMQISEVVRGADLLLSTFRQLLIYRALGFCAPQFYHTELIRDSSDQRLAKRHDSLSLRALRKSGADPEELRRRYACDHTAKLQIPKPKSQANLN